MCLETGPRYDVLLKNLYHTCQLAPHPKYGLRNRKKQGMEKNLVKVDFGLGLDRQALEAALVLDLR